MAVPVLPATARLSLVPSVKAVPPHGPAALALGSRNSDNDPHAGPPHSKHTSVVGRAPHTRRPGARKCAAPQPTADPAETDDIGVGPQRKDLLVILACFVVDVFFSGYYDGAPALTRFGFELPLVLVLVLLLPAYAALAWRRRAPWPVFLFIVGFCLVMALSLELFEPFAVTGLALYAVARRTPARRANPALVLMAFPSMSNAVTATNLTGDS